MSDSHQPTHALSKTDAAALTTGSARADGGLDLLGPDEQPPDRGGGAGPWHRPLSPRLLLRFKGTILVVFAVLSAVVLSAIWLLLVPTYRASGHVEVRSLVPRLISHTEETGLIPQYRQYLQSQVQIIQNPAVLERVLERPDTQRTDWYDEAPQLRERLLGTKPTRLARLTRDLTAAVLRGTELIEISMTARDPESAALIASGVREEYLRYAKERLSEEDSQLLTELEKERRDLNGAIGYSKEQVGAARKTLRTNDPDELIAQQRVRLDQLEAELEQIDYSLELRRRQLGDPANLEAASQPAADEGRGVPAGYEHDAQWQGLKNGLRAAEDHAELVRLRFGPKSDKTITALKLVESAREALEERQAYLKRMAPFGMPPPTLGTTREAIAPSAATLRAEVEQLKLQRDQLQQAVEGLRVSFERDFNRAEAHHEHTEELERIEARLRLVQNRLYELDEKQRVPAIIREIGPVLRPSAPANDKRRRLSVAAVVAALCAGVACAYVRATYSSQVQDAAEVRREVRGAFLGHVPLRRGQDWAALEAYPIQLESVRMVRTALLNRLDAAGGNVVQVTSAGLGSGKSTLALLLARSVAQCDKRVLLVDADARRSSLAQRLEIAPTPGLADVLADPKGEPQGIHATSIPGLSVLPRGVSAEQDGLEPLANGAFSEVVERWRKEYDMILLDSAPLLASADAGILARHADGTILVVRERHCRRPAVVEALAVLSATGGRLLGTVFVGSGHGAGYGYGYAYEHEHESTSQSDEA